MRTREETNFRNVKSKDGTFSPHIGERTAERITRYCKYKNLNRTNFVETVMNSYLDKAEKTLFESMTKEQLISLIIEEHHESSLLDILET